MQKIEMALVITITVAIHANSVVPSHGATQQRKRMNGNFVMSSLVAPNLNQMTNQSLTQTIDQLHSNPLGQEIGQDHQDVHDLIQAVLHLVQGTLVGLAVVGLVLLGIELDIHQKMIILDSTLYNKIVLVLI